MYTSIRHRASAQGCDQCPSDFPLCSRDPFAESLSIAPGASLSLPSPPGHQSRDVEAQGWSGRCSLGRRKGLTCIMLHDFFQALKTDPTKTAFGAHFGTRNAPQVLRKPRHRELCSVVLGALVSIGCRCIYYTKTMVFGTRYPSPGAVFFHKFC